MKFQILQTNLKGATNNAIKLVNQRAQLPVLSNFKIKATKNELHLLATNLEKSIIIKLGAKVEKEGEITIPAKEFTEIISNFPPTTLSIFMEKEKMHIVGDSIKAKLVAIPGNDFPEIPEATSSSSFVLDTDAFIQKLTKVLFSASIDDSRPILTGILFALNKDGLSLVATDGFRLSQTTLDLNGLNPISVIVPKSTLVDLPKFIQGTKKLTIDIQDAQKQIIFAADNVAYTSRLIEGNFPDFKKIIPQNPSLIVTVSRTELAPTIKLAAVFAKTSGNIVKLTVTKNSLEISAKSSQLGSQVAKVDAKVTGLEEEEFTISYNYRYLDEFLANSSGESVELNFTNQATAGLFLDPSQKDFLHLIMPVKA